MDKRIIKLNKRTLDNNTHINIVDDTIKEICSWKIDSYKFKVAVLLYFITLGILYFIVLYWKRIYITLNCLPCDPLNADYFVITDANKQMHVIQSKKENFLHKHPSLEKYLYNIPAKKKMGSSCYIGSEFFNSREELTIITFRMNKYVYSENENAFIPVKFDLSRFRNKEIHEKFSRGIRSIDEYNYLLNKFGLNSLKMENKTFIKILKEIFLTPLYFYQVYSILVWFVDNYTSFAVIVIICNIIILLITSYHHYQNHNRIVKLNSFIPSIVKRDFNFVNANSVDNAEDNVNINNSENESSEHNSNNTNTVNYLDNENESLQIVPGDIIYIRSNETVPCDCIILDGVCTVNESDLTGESTLVMKSLLPNDIKNFSYENNNKSFLFHGTIVEKCESAQNEGTLTLMAINTGFNTNRGNLILNILFPKPTNFKLFKDLKHFFFIMFLIYLISAAFLTLIFVYQEEPRWETIVLITKTLDLLTIILPPSMNICLSFISFYFHFTLNYKNISCISDKRMTAAGRVNIIVLDKTGTLTEEGLEIYGFQTTIVKTLTTNYITQTDKRYLDFDKIEKDTKIYHSVHKEFWKKFTCFPNSPLFNNYQLNLQNNLIFYLECLATCHSIDKLKDDYLGNSLDKTIFDSLYWTQEKSQDDEQNGENLNSENDINSNMEYISSKNHLTGVSLKLSNRIKYDMIPKNSFKITEESIFRKFNNPFSGKRYRLTIIKRFEFSSKFQSMSVIVKNCLDDSYRFFIKGAPEKILQSCHPDTLPQHFNEKLMEHTKNGFRVIACATKLLYEGPTENNDVLFQTEEDRKKYEKNLTFLGFIIFKNKLKRDTKIVIGNLKTSDCKLIMATGDNPFTSIAVARECELIENDKNVYLIDMEKDIPDKIKVTPLIIENDIDKIEIENEDQIRFSLTNEPKIYIPTIKRKSRQKRRRISRKDSDSLSSESAISSERKLLPEKKDKEKKSLISLRKRNISDFSIINHEKDFYMNIIKLIETEAFICISGKAFDYLMMKYEKEKSKILTSTIFTEFIKLIERNGKIFFRMNPYNKIDLINLYKENQSNIVAMCGDGANDCGALLTSDVGIMIRRNDRNNGVTSHFLSNEDSISCIELIIRNGRACFENSVIILKYMIIYAVIQLTSALILYSTKREITPTQYLFVDLFVVLITCLLAAKTSAAYKLNPQRPSFSIIEKCFVLDLLGHIIIQVSAQLLFFLIFKKYRGNTFKDNIDTFRSYLFIFSIFQYLSVIFSLTFFSKHRKIYYANKIYIFYLSIIVFHSISMLTNSLTIFPIASFEPSNYMYDLESEINRLLTLFAGVINFALTMSFETFMIKCYGKTKRN